MVSVLEKALLKKFFSCYSASSLSVTAGDHSLSRNDGTEQASGVRRTIPHPQYSSRTLRHDIMLLELSVRVCR